ncbi:MAG: hypothetical protein WBK91_07005 [Alphaproteobacteria bacterium]
MGHKFPALPQQVKDMKLPMRQGQPDVVFDDLAAMLELEIILGRRRDFRTRLGRALVAAYDLGNNVAISHKRPRGQRARAH